jgi:prepilin-type N-terminal cleavage/methylation domain-containing protein
MIRYLRDIHAQRRGEELAEKGFTLIELLIVIVVLGILAATVVFALTGVTGQSAQAACNSDAKTMETAVQAFIDSPSNTNNTPPANAGELLNPPAADGFTANDQFIHALPTNTAYAITVVPAGTTANVWVAAPAKAAAVQYDPAAGGANPCSAAT